MTVPAVERPPLDPARLAALAPRWQVEVLPRTASTNGVVAERARAGAPEGLVVTTEHQYAGRGRLDRGWEMPPRAALAVSVLLRPDVGDALWPWLPLAAGVAVAGTPEVGGRLKWPNDVLIADRKVCGILAERVETPLGPAAVIGIGLNVSLTAEELPVPSGTSLLLARGVIPDRTTLLSEVLARLAEVYESLATEPGSVRRAYRALSATVGREVRIELPGGEVVIGRASAVADDGRLAVESAAGEFLVAAGDVVHARLA